MWQSQSTWEHSHGAGWIFQSLSLELITAYHYILRTSISADNIVHQKRKGKSDYGFKENSVRLFFLSGHFEWADFTSVFKRWWLQIMTAWKTRPKRLIMAVVRVKCDSPEVRTAQTLILMIGRRHGRLRKWFSGRAFRATVSPRTPSAIVWNRPLILEQRGDVFDISGRWVTSLWALLPFH